MKDDIDDKICYLTSELIKNNKILINAFKIRLIKRILRIFESHNISFNKELLEKLINDYCINKFREANTELSRCYKKMLFRYLSIVSHYIQNNPEDKNEIKSITSIFIKKLYSKDNPLLNDKICIDFLEVLKSKTFVYDNISLNKEIEIRIKEDGKDLIDEINKNNNQFLANGIRDILICCLKEK